MPSPRTSICPAIVAGALIVDVVALASKFGLVVRHEARTLVDQAQRKIRFARPRWAAEQDALAPKRNRRAMDSDHAAL